MRRSFYDISEISAMLAERIETLVTEILPNGRRSGPEWRVGSINGEPGGSLGVCIRGSKAGVWKDFAGDAGGDALDLVSAVLFKGDKKQGLAWAKDWLGLTGQEARAPGRDQKVVKSQMQERARREAWIARKKVASAQRIFYACPRSFDGTPVYNYLKSRGIPLEKLAALPGAIRCGRLEYKNTKVSYDCMVACVIRNQNIVAVHRTYLEDLGGYIGKARVETAKMCLGPIKGGYIPIQRGASGKPLHQASEGEALIITEGIEDALVVAAAMPGFRVIAGISLGNLAAIELPAAVSLVIIAADNDVNNPTAQAALLKARANFEGQGKELRLSFPSSGKDFNDMILQEAG